MWSIIGTAVQVAVLQLISTYLVNTQSLWQDLGSTRPSNGASVVLFWHCGTGTVADKFLLT